MPQTGFKTWLQVVLVLALVVAWPLGAGAADPNPAPLPLAQTFIAKDGAFTFSFPRGWVHGEDSGAITLANSQEALDAINGEPAPGHIALLIWPTTADVSEGWDVELAGKTHKAVLAELMDQSNSDTDFTMLPTDTSVGDKPATMVKATAHGRDTIVLLIDNGPNNVTAVAAGSAAGEMPQFESTVLAIAASVSYHPAGAAPAEGVTPAKPGATATPTAESEPVHVTQWDTFTSEDGKFTFDFPQGWVHGTDNGAIVVGNNQKALDNVSGDAVPGEFVILIWPTQADMVPVFDTAPEAKTHQEVLKALMAQDNKPKFTQEPTEITVGNLPATQMKGQEGDREFMMLLVDSGTDNVTGLLAGASPGELPQYESIVLALAATLSHRGEAAEAAAPAGKTPTDDGRVHQWASKVEATSEYGITQWNAMQAAGAPNVEECKDSTSAWALEGEEHRGNPDSAL